MNKFTWKEKISYQIDKLLSKGTGVLILSLFSITAVVVVLVGIVMYLIDPEFGGNPFVAVWNTFQFALDSGTLAGYANNTMGIFALFLVTICGIFITSMLIGVLSSGLETKLESLRRGDSKVLEKNHTVIIGYNDNIFPMVRELIIANENEKKSVIVILGKAEKAAMESELSDRIPDTQNTEIICRNGAASDFVALGRCSLETAKSVIINNEDDAEVVKAILAVTHILNSSKDGRRDTHITAGISNSCNLEAAKIAGEGRTEVIYFKSAISRIIANTFHQPGLSRVYTELFDFDGDEIYIEHAVGLTGKTFGEAVQLFEQSTLLGIKRDSVPLLNPPMDTVLTDGDDMILLASDNGVSIPAKENPPIENNLVVKSDAKISHLEQERLLVLGCNELLPMILNELDHYIAPDSIVTVATDQLRESETALLEDQHTNLTVKVDLCDIYNKSTLEAYADSGYQKIIVLSRLDCDLEESDAKNLIILLHLKAISERKGIRYNVVSQMLSPANGELAKIAHVNDFVISTNLTSLIITQISENRDLAAIFEDILDADGSELYMKPVSLYVKTGVPVDLYTITYAASLRNEVVIGYKTLRDNAGSPVMEIITNPKKSDTVVFSENDRLIVLAEEG